MIVKGKRSKRPRASSSTSSGGGEFNSNTLVSSPTSTSTTREEDEDLANCLILLARGGPDPQTDRVESKSNRRQFTETENGKVGVCVYECKTCSRSFSSFQALGGHRASHKKSKYATYFDQKKSAPPPDKEAEEVEEAKFTIAPPPPTELIGDVENKPKIHECSICGSEFSSGQALGGHMRRHRSGPAADAAMRSAGDYSSHDDDHQAVEKARRILALDLNLPAPEDDGRERSFEIFHPTSSRVSCSPRRRWWIATTEIRGVDV